MTCASASRVPEIQRGVTLEKTSLMPAFDAKRLPESDLTDLIGYLSTLRGGDYTTVR